MKFVTLYAEYQYLSRILAAKEDKKVASMPQLNFLPSVKKASKDHLNEVDQDRYLGHYQFEGEGMKIILVKMGF
jgi:hypothetical protein